jgi:chromosome condensin MukBEF ATPase and DNA-binding subunit MukB
MSKMKSEADQRFDELILLTERLALITERETEALKAKRPRELAPLVDEKALLSAHYARAAAQLKRNSELLNTVSPPLRQKLKEVTQRFQSALTELTERLERVRKISEGMVRAIAEDAAERRAKPIGYGKTASPPAPLSQPPMYLAFNRVV